MGLVSIKEYMQRNKIILEQLYMSIIDDVFIITPLLLDINWPFFAYIWDSTKLISLLPAESLVESLKREDICVCVCSFAQSCRMICGTMALAVEVFRQKPGESGLVSRGSQGLRSPLESRRGSLGAP